jgi:glycosyltransferase involved in cell wall biosynthesis
LDDECRFSALYEKGAQGIEGENEWKQTRLTLKLLMYLGTKKKHITVLVSNDLQYDQRVSKVCSTLIELNYEITLVGRMLPSSSKFERPYEVRRFDLWFRSGALFYAALNIRLFFYLLVKKTDVILANDLDTLLPAFLVSKIRSKKLVYDSHEYFTEAEGLTGRAFQKNVWLAIERFVFPRLKLVYTVNESIASIYRAKYHVNVRVLRNIPILQPLEVVKSRTELALPIDKKIVLLQGAFIDPDRGGVELVEAMQYIEGVLLLIIGDGRDIVNLKEIVVAKKLNEKVRILPRMAFQELRQYTANVDIGVSLDKPLHLNYTYSLPNKMFDYIHAGTPVLVSDLPELRRIVDQYGVGKVLPEVKPQTIAQTLREMFADSDYAMWKKNCLLARNELNWQRESEVIRSVYKGL